MPAKVLYRSTTDVKICGLVAGLAKYLDVDAGFLRLIALAVIILTGILPGTLAYLIGSAIIPAEPAKDTNAEK